MLLWLGESSGVDKKSILLAKRRAILAPRNFTSQSAAFRKVIPWGVIDEQLAEHSAR